MSIVLESRQAIAAPSVSVIIPAYHEAANLPLIVPRVCQAMADAQIDGEVIIVDDDSGDGTQEVCAQLAVDYPVRLEVRRNERGLSSAVMRGLDLARGDILLVMDADLSHPPEKIPELVDALGDVDVDFVIGSRYVDGGGTDENWGLARWLNSRVATLMARPFTGASDPMAGFFALRRCTYQRARDLNPVGYKIGLELLVKCGCKQVREVPIHFSDRLHGESKLSLREQLNYIRHLGRLAEYKLRNLPRIFKFGFVGGTGFFVDLGVFTAGLTVLPVPMARALAIWVAMTWNFYWNRRWTFFESREGTVLWQYVLFCGACLLGAVVSWGTCVALWKYLTFFAEYPVAAAALGILAGVAFNFVASCRWVFRTTGDED